MPNKSSDQIRMKNSIFLRCQAYIVEILYLFHLFEKIYPPLLKTTRCNSRSCFSIPGNRIKNISVQWFKSVLKTNNTKSLILDTIVATWRHMDRKPFIIYDNKIKISESFRGSASITQSTVPALYENRIATNLLEHLKHYWSWINKY